MCYIYSLELFNYLLSFADILIIQFSSVTQSCLTLNDPVDCSPPGSSIHGIFQARVLSAQ